MSIPYSNRIENIMYKVICSKSNLTYVVSVVCMFMTNFGHAY